MSWGAVTMVEVAVALPVLPVLSVELLVLSFCSFDPQEVKKKIVAEQISIVNLSVFMILSF
jgi:hypothetical protein